MSGTLSHLLVNSIHQGTGGPVDSRSRKLDNCTFRCHITIHLCNFSGGQLLCALRGWPEQLRPDDTNSQMRRNLTEPKARSEVYQSLLARAVSARIAPDALSAITALFPNVFVKVIQQLPIFRPPISGASNSMFVVLEPVFCEQTFSQIRD